MKPNILPQEWQYTVAADKGKQFKILKDLMHRADVSEVVNACDAGREGELIFRFVYHQAGCKKPFNIMMFGKDIEKEAAAIRAEIACVSQQTSIDTYLSLEENMLFQSRLYKIPKAEALDRMEKLITAFGLQQYRKYPVSSYSGGVKRRLDIALNMMTNPKLLFLDEPTVGMDIQSRQLMWEMISQIRNDFGTTVFLTTHYLEEADNLSDTICIMKEGKEVIQGTPLELRTYLRQDTVQIHFPNSSTTKQYLPQFRLHFHEQDIYAQNALIVINTHNSKTDLEKAVCFLLQEKIPFTGIEITQPTLEDVFLRLTSKREEE